MIRILLYLERAKWSKPFLDSALKKKINRKKNNLKFFFNFIIAYGPKYHILNFRDRSGE